MKKIIPIVIIDFNSYKRTIKYIEDFIHQVLTDKELSFVIVDTSENIDNYNYFKNEVIKKYKVNNIESLEISDVDRVLNINNYEYIISSKLVNVIHIKCKENYGFAIGNNIGATVIKERCEVEYILFSNSDIRFEEKLDLDKLLDYFKVDKKIALIGPRVIGLDNKNQSPCKKLSLWNRWNFNSLIWPLNSIIRLKILNTYDDLIIKNENSYVYRIIGAFMLFDFKKFQEIEMFDEGTFLYAEELIIAEKLIKKKYKTFYVINEKIIHEQGGIVNKKFSSYQTLRNKFESEMLYYSKYIGINKFWILISKMLFNIYLYKLKVIHKVKNLKLLDSRGEN